MTVNQSVRANEDFLVSLVEPLLSLLHFMTRHCVPFHECDQYGK
jgi:hypothetical protein